MIMIQEIMMFTRVKEINCERQKVSSQGQVAKKKNSQLNKM